MTELQGQAAVLNAPKGRPGACQADKDILNRANLFGRVNKR